MGPTYAGPEFICLLYAGPELAIYLIIASSIDHEYVNFC